MLSYSGLNRATERQAASEQYKDTAPCLSEGTRLKRLDEYAILYERNLAKHDVLHPSHAFVLSLCNGSVSVKEIIQLVRHTYDLEASDASNFVDAVLRRYSVFIESVIPSDRSKVDDLSSAARFLYKPKGSGAGNIDARSEPLPVPISITLNLTYECNFRCLYCYQNVESYRSALPLSRCLELVDEAAELGVCEVGLSGGEPTLYSGWMDIVEAVTANDMTLLLTTNGVVIGTRLQMVDELRARGLRSITVSLDASMPELHDELTQSKGTFALVIAAIESLVKADIRVSIKQVLSHRNYHDLQSFLRFATGLGVAEVGITLMEPGAVGSPANRLKPISVAQLSEARAMVDAYRNDVTCTRVYPPRKARCQWSEKDWYPCGGLFVGMCIHPWGDVTICDKLREPEFVYGNVLTQGLDAIWRGAKFKDLRSRTVDPRVISSDCSACAKLPVCRTSCFIDSKLSSGGYYDRHPLCAGPFR